MTFLAPMVGIAAAAICVPLLLALYFLKLRRRPVRVSSTFLWQQAVKDLQANVPFRWLRFNWLLLLQLLIVLCLIVAAARPVIPAIGPGAARTVLIIDTSASMSALDGDRAFRPSVLTSRGATGGGAAITAPPPPPSATAPISRLDEARARAERMIESLGADQQMMIVRFASEATILSPMTDDRQVLREALERVRPTDQPGDPLAAIRLVRAVLDRPRDESFEGARPVVLLVSDGGVPEYDQTPAHAREVSRALAGINLALVRCGPGPGGVANAGIVSISARRDFDDPTTVRVFARVINSATRALSTQLVLSVSGRTLERRAIEIPGASEAQALGASLNAAGVGPDGSAGGAGTAGAAGAIQPGELNVTFTISEAMGGVVLLRLNDSDLLVSDDVAGVVISPLASPRVLLVSPQGSKDADAALLSAIDVSRPASLEVIDGQQYVARLNSPPVVGPGGSGAVTAFTDIDVVILDRVASDPAPPVASIHFGAAVSSRTLARARSLDEGRVTIGAQLVAVAALGAGEEPAIQTVLAWNREHPLMRYVSLETIFVSPAWTLVVPDPAALARGNLSVTTLASSAAGELIAFVRESSPSLVRPVERIVVAFPLARSNWGPHFSFPVFLSGAIDLFARRAEARVGRWHTTTEALTFEVAPGATELSLASAEGVIVRAPITALVGGGRENGARSLGVVERVGVYQLSGAEPGATGGQGAIAVNLASAQESMARTFDEVRLSIDAPITAQARIDGPPAGREIWHWFVIGAMVLLLLEWLLYAWLMHA